VLTRSSGVAHALVKGSQQPKFEDATLFQAWFPANSPKVPSEISFSPSRSGLAQWGHSIDPDTPPVRYAKLELQARGRQVELEKLADVIKGLQLMARFRADQGAGARNEVPQFLTLSAEDIVTEFLDRVVRRWHNEMQSENEALLAANPLDLVITHPGVGCPGSMIHPVASEALTRCRNGHMKPGTRPCERFSPPSP